MLLGPKEPPHTRHQGEPCGNRWAKNPSSPALPGSRKRKKTGAQQWAGEGANRLGAREASAPGLIPSGGIPCSLSLALAPPPSPSLSLPHSLMLLCQAAWKPQLFSLPRRLTCGLKKGTESHKSRVNCKALSTEGTGKNESY